MSWIHFWNLVIEPTLLISVLGFLVKTVVTNSKKIDLFTEEICSSTLAAQAFLQEVDRDFEMINNCAKSIKTVFLNLGKMYKDISQGKKAIEETIGKAKHVFPEEVRENLSRLCEVSIRSCPGSGEQSDSTSVSRWTCALDSEKEKTADKEDRPEGNHSPLWSDFENESSLASKKTVDAEA